MTLLEKDKVIILFYKSLTNIGGAENLLIKEYEFFQNEGLYPIIFTFENKILDKSFKVIKIKNIFDLILKIKKLNLIKLFVRLDISIFYCINFRFFFIFFTHTSTQFVII